MRLHAAEWYRAGLIAGMIVLSLVAFFVVGGQAGAILWMVGFLLMWGATRFANRYFSGFFLGDDGAPELEPWSDEAPAEETSPEDRERG